MKQIETDELNGEIIVRLNKEVTRLEEKRLFYRALALIFSFASLFTYMFLNW